MWVSYLFMLYARRLWALRKGPSKRSGDQFLGNVSPLVQYKSLCDVNKRKGIHDRESFPESLSNLNTQGSTTKYVNSQFQLWFYQELSKGPMLFNQFLDQLKLVKMPFCYAQNHSAKIPQSIAYHYVWPALPRMSRAVKRNKILPTAFNCGTKAVHIFFSSSLSQASTLGSGQ